MPDKVSVKTKRPVKKAKPVRRNGDTGYERMQQSLREDILEGRIASGARLKVAEIAARYGTSTNPAREALQALEGEGLVVITPNRGARVRMINEDLVQNVFDIRGLLEPYILRTFVEFATADDVAALKEFQKGCDEAEVQGDYPTFHVNNVALHDYINERHFNVEAVKIMKKHNGWLRALSRKHPLTLAHMRRSNQEHWQLIDAVERGDPDEAVRIIETHMGNSRKVFLANMRRDRMLADAATG